MLEKDTVGDYIIATGQTHSVLEILEVAFGLLGLDWRSYITEDQDYARTVDTNTLCGDATKARLKLGWIPQIKFEDMIKDMIENDVKLFS